MNNVETKAGLAKEMKKTVAGIVGASRNKAAVDENWLSNDDRLCQRILTSDPVDFLRWDVIARTMVVGNADFIAEELAFLQALPDFKNRWEKALEESLVGSPDMFPDFPSSSGNLIHQAYHLANYEQKTGIRISDSGLVLEFGGGYGGMCRLLHNLGFKGRYIIFDLPPLSALQRFFLKMNGIPTEHEVPSLESVGTTLCCWDLEQLKTVLASQPNLETAAFIATWSLSESPVALRRDLLPLVAQFNSFLIAYQGLFGEVDNDAFFKDSSATMTRVEWNHWKISHLPNQRYKDNYYLMGKKKHLVASVRSSM